MQQNPLCGEIRGYKKVAQSSTSGTYADKLVEMEAAYSALTPEQKLTSFIVIGVAIYPLITHTGTFSRASLSATVVYTEQINLTNHTYLYSRNGTITDGSSTSDTIVFELWIWE